MGGGGIAGPTKEYHGTLVQGSYNLDKNLEVITTANSTHPLLTKHQYVTNIHPGKPEALNLDG